MLVCITVLPRFFRIDPKCLAQDCLHGIMEAPSAKLRKRDAVGNLRELADDLGVQQRTAKLQDAVCAHVVITMLSLVTCRGHAPHHGLHPHPSSFYIFKTPSGVR